jgi:GntR family transcriptional regulator, vanillate catabolism transcriptional regulator
MSNDTLENTLKEMILREELAPGERLTEAGLADRLGVSRTPIRTLLPRLASEGFLSPVGKRGYVVAHFGEQEIHDALDLRALLEGWAARTLAQQGADEATLSALEECLAMGDALFAKRHLDREDEQQYGVMNERFHRLIIEACRSPLLAMFIERLNNVPFVAPAVIVFDRIGLRKAFDMLHRAHGFHHAIVDAIRQRDGARAEILFREHANHQRLSMFERRKANGPAPTPGTPAQPGPGGQPRAGVSSSSSR